MAEEKRIWLHIGATKTGTTAFQSFCAMHADALRQAGILYPETGRAGVAHHRLAWAVNPLGPTEPTDGLYGALLREIDASAAKDILISSEVFFIRSAVPALAGLLKGRDVRIVAFLRRQDEWAELMYAQYVKQPEFRATQPIREAPEMRIIEPVLDYASWMATWAEHFGNDRMFCQPYFGSGSDRTDTIAAMFSLIGRPEIASWEIPRDAGALNRSISAPELEIVRLTNDLSLKNEDRGRLLYHFQRAGSRERVFPPGRIALLADEERAEIIGKYRDGNDRVFANWSSNAGIDLFKNDIRSNETSKTEQPYDLRCLTDLATVLWLESRYDANSAAALDLVNANQILSESQMLDLPQQALRVYVAEVPVDEPVRQIKAYSAFVALFSGHVDVEVNVIPSTPDEAERLADAGISVAVPSSGSALDGQVEDRDHDSTGTLVIAYGDLPGLPCAAILDALQTRNPVLVIDGGAARPMLAFENREEADRALWQDTEIDGGKAPTLIQMSARMREVHGSKVDLICPGGIISVRQHHDMASDNAFRSSLAGLLEDRDPT